MKVVAEVKFKWWAVLLKPLWMIQIKLGCKDIWIPECSFNVTQCGENKGG